MTLLSILATIAGSAMAVSNIPQAYRIFKRKSARDISITTYAILFAGGTIWFLYGLELGNTPLILSNGIGTLTVGLVIAGWFLYGRR